jgi:hypothetical protein
MWNWKSCEKKATVMQSYWQHRFHHWIMDGFPRFVGCIIFESWQLDDIIGWPPFWKIRDTMAGSGIILMSCPSISVWQIQWKQWQIRKIAAILTEFHDCYIRGPYVIICSSIYWSSIRTPSSVGPVINQSAWGCMEKSSPSKPMHGLTMQYGRCVISPQLSCVSCEYSEDISALWPY